MKNKSILFASMSVWPNSWWVPAAASNHKFKSWKILRINCDIKIYNQKKKYPINLGSWNHQIKLFSGCTLFAYSYLAFVANNKFHFVHLKVHVFIVFMYNPFKDELIQVQFYKSLEKWLNINVWHLFKNTIIL